MKKEPAIDNVYLQIKSVACANDYLVHAKSILARYAKQDRLDILNEIAKAYLVYLRANEITGYDDASVEKRVKALNDYYDFIHTHGYDNVYSAQTKFRPTILEEFLAILCRDMLDEVRHGKPNDALGLGGVKAYANLYFYGRDFSSFALNPTIGLNVKDQDFAIYRKVELKVDGSRPVMACIPVVAVECKTFIDKTMLEGSVATAEKIKTGNPYALFCMVSELYDVGMDVDPAYSRIDQIYILRKCRRRDPWQKIESAVVISFVHRVIEHLKRPWSDMARKLAETGTLI